MLDKARFDEIERRGLYYAYRQISEEEREEWHARHRARREWREAAQREGKICSECGTELDDTVYRYTPLLAGGRWRTRPTTDQVPICEECAPDWLPELQTRVYTLHMYSHKVPCENCGRDVVFVSGVEDPWARAFCSDNCKSEHKRNRQAQRRVGPHTKTCEVCGKEFVAKRADAKTCSPSCRQKAYRKRLQVSTAPSGAAS